MNAKQKKYHAYIKNLSAEDQYKHYVESQVCKPFRKDNPKKCRKRASKIGLKELEYEYKCKKSHFGLYRSVKQILDNSEIVINNILVLGGRWGSDILFLREIGFDCNIIAIDLFNPPLSDLVLYCDAHYLSDMKFDYKFDLVWANHVFEHFFKPSKVIQEIELMTSPTSCLVIISPQYWKDKFEFQTEFSDQESFLNLFNNSNFNLYNSGFKRNYFYIFRKE